MPKQIKCNSVKIGVSKIFNPKLGLDIESEVNEVCGNDTFQAVNHITVFSAFESPNGQAGMQIIPVFKCDVCGCIMDVEKAREEALKPQFKVNGK